MLLILFSWLLLIFIGIKYHKEPLAIPFSKESTLALKGICAIEIMLGHIGLHTNSIVLFANRKAGILFVGIFLALSGYGLIYSLCNKENYLKGFFRQRILKILLPAYVVYIFNTLISQESLNNLINPIQFFHSTNWYVWEIIVLYFLFYIFAKLLSHKQLCLALFLLSLIFIGVAYIFRIDIPWYGSTLCFSLGIFYYLYRDEIYTNYINCKKYLPTIAIMDVALITGILVFFILGESFVGYVIARNVASTAFVLLTIFLLSHFTIGNRLSNWLGKYSYEIFLFHFVYLKVFKSVNNQFLYAILVISTTIFSAYILSILYNKIKK